MNKYRNNPKYFINQDLIGVKLNAKHKYNSTWSEYRSLGIVLDETKYMLHIQPTTGEIKQYVKDQYIFQSKLPQPDGSTIVLQFDGAKIVGRPEQRIKLIRKTRRKLR